VNALIVRFSARALDGRNLRRVAPEADRGYAAPMGRRVSGVALGACLAALALAAPAQAEISIVDDAGNVVSEIKKGKCKVTGKKGKKEFVGFGESPEGWELNVYILNESWGGVKDDYTLFYGVRDVGFDLYGPDSELYSNQFPIPGTPPGLVGGGAIKFGKHGRKLAIGFAPAPNRDFTRGVSFAGAMKCKYKPGKEP
jgi:hypothetical protein